MPGLLGQVGGRDGDHRAAGVRQAVAAHPAAGQAAQGTAAACAHDEQVPGAAGSIDEHLAGLAAQHRGCGPEICGQAPPRQVEGLPEPLPGGLLPDCAQVGGRLTASSPPGGSQASTGINGASSSRARSAAKRSACRLPGDPLAPTMIRHAPDTVVLLEDAKWLSRPANLPDAG